MKIYHYYYDNKEFYQEEEYNNANGMGIPAHSTEIKPLPSKEGFAVIFNVTEWEYIEDHRGSFIYSKETGEEYSVDKLGPIPEEFTKLAPNSKYDKFIEGEWVYSKEAEAEENQANRELKHSEVMNRLLMEFGAIEDLRAEGLATKKEVEYQHTIKKYSAICNRCRILKLEYPEAPTYPEYNTKDKLYKASFWTKFKR